MSLQNLFPLFGFTLLLTACQTDSPPLLSPGMAINQSMTFQADTLLARSGSLSQPVLTIEGDGITVDFGGALLIGSSNDSLPDSFSGLAIRVRNSKNITLRNLNARGYQMAILAENCDSLTIEHSNLSYNYRPALPAQGGKAWPEKAAAVYLYNCQAPALQYLTVTGGQHGLLLEDCHNGQLSDNDIRFNSGIGIGLQQSSNNHIRHNLLDWNVGAPLSAGILLSGPSHGNTLAYNSATHNQQGIALTGSCSRNIIYGNDCSFALGSGIALNGQEHIAAANQLHNCQYGITGDSTAQSLLAANSFQNCGTGIALRSAQGNTLRYNTFQEGGTGVQLDGCREEHLQHNRFTAVQYPLSAGLCSGLAINDDNLFWGFEVLLSAPAPNEGLVLVKNRIGPGSLGQAAPFARSNPRIKSLAGTLEAEQWRAMEEDGYRPAPLPGRPPFHLAPPLRSGQAFILTGKWGPYDFRRPIAVLRDTADGQFTFLLLAPNGNWRLTGGEGFSRVTPKTGTFPVTLTAQPQQGAEQQRLAFEFIGEGIVNEYGQALKKGAYVTFGWASPPGEK